MTQFMKNPAMITLLLLAVLFRPSSCGELQSGNYIELECEDFAYTLSSDGKNLSLRPYHTGQNLIPDGACMPFAVAVTRDGSHASNRIVRTGDGLLVEFDGLPGSLSLSCQIHDDHIMFETASSTLPGVDTLRFLNISVAAAGAFGRMLNCAWYDSAACLLRSLALNTNAYAVQNKTLELRAECYPEFGIPGARAALIACRNEHVISVMEKLETRYSLPGHRLGGVWNKISPEVSSSYLFIDVDETNVDKVIGYAKAGGFRYVMTYAGTWSASTGSYPVNEQRFPGRMSGLRETVESLHNAGLKAGLHVFTGSISKDDAFVTPVPDPGLAADRIFTLSGDISATADCIPVVESPEGMPVAGGYTVKGGNTIRIGDELITYSGVSTDAPFAFTGCERGAYGTEPAGHRGNTPVHHLAELLGFFMADPDSPLFERIAARIGYVVNECGFDMIYLDCSEALLLLGPHWHTVTKALIKIQSQFRREVLVQGSSASHLLWHVYSRGVPTDYASIGTKEYADRVKLPMLHMDRLNLMPAELGWMGMLLHSPGAPATFPDEIEHGFSMAAAFDAPMSIEPTVFTLDGHGRTGEMLSIMKNWSDVRERNLLSLKTKERMRKRTAEYNLVKNANGTYAVVPVRYDDFSVTCESGISKDSLAVLNTFGRQPLTLRIIGMKTPAAYGGPDNIALIDFARSDQWTVHSSGEKGEHAGLSQWKELDPSEFRGMMHEGNIRFGQYEWEEPKSYESPGLSGQYSIKNDSLSSVGCCIEISVRNALPDTGLWWGKTFVLGEPPDMSGHKSLGVWVYGDGSGSLLSIGLEGAHRTSRRDYVVGLDFHGWKYCELAEPETGRVFEYRLPYFIRRPVRPFSYSSVAFVTILLSRIPPHAKVSAQLGRIEGLKERDAAVENVRFTVQGEAIEFPVMIRPGEYLEYGDGGDAVQYDPNGHEISRFKPAGNVPLLQHGFNSIQVSSHNPHGESRLKIQVITRGEELND